MVNLPQGNRVVTDWARLRTEVTAENIGTLDDQSWENPYDVAKGHRGFIDGDFIMMMYAWSPNWQANSVGNDHYNLYARRSFDGGETWTTMPRSSSTPELPDGVSVMRTAPTPARITKTAPRSPPSAPTTPPAKFEQARNLSQLIGNKETILDPRYTPTGGLKMLPISDLRGFGFTGYDDDDAIHPNSSSSTRPATTPPSPKAKPCRWICSTAGPRTGAMTMIWWNTTTRMEKS